MHCRIVVTDQIAGLEGGSFVDDTTLWIVVSPDAPDPCHTIADLVHHALGGRLPDSMHYDHDQQLPPGYDGQIVPMPPSGRHRQRRSSDRGDGGLGGTEPERRSPV